MQTGKLRRQFRAEPQDFTGDWMFDDQDMGMQALSGKLTKRGLGRSRQQRGLGPEPWAVDLIAQERVADGGEMHPNLVGAAGFQPTRQQARDRRFGAAALAAAGGFRPP